MHAPVPSGAGAFLSPDKEPFMRFPAWIKKTGKVLLDIVELYIPMFTFTGMFLLFLLAIFFRYFLNNPLTWPYELTVIGFIWTAVLGATYTRRVHSHVKFTLLYDRTGPKGQLLTRLAGNTLIAATFLIALYPSYDWVRFMSFQKSTVVRIPFDIIYFPFVVFLALVIGHCIYDIVVDIRKLMRGEY